MKTLHCTVEDLLAIRDGEGSSGTLRHLEGCQACQAELDRLHQRVAALKALPALRPPRDRWPVVRDIVQAARRRRRRMLLPSLYALHADGLVADKLRIVGTARSAHSDEEYRDFAKQALDLGAYGIVWPHISTVDQAYNAVASCRYPRLKSAPRYEPAGVRGDGPTEAAGGQASTAQRPRQPGSEPSRSCHVLRTPLRRYPRWANRGVILSNPSGTRVVPSRTRADRQSCRCWLTP